jgi:hypothetical protein
MHKIKTMYQDALHSLQFSSPHSTVQYISSLCGNLLSYYFTACHVGPLPLNTGCFLLLERYLSHCLVNSCIIRWPSGLNAEWIVGISRFLHFLLLLITSALSVFTTMYNQEFLMFLFQFVVHWAFPAGLSPPMLQLMTHRAVWLLITLLMRGVK